MVKINDTNPIRSSYGVKKRSGSSSVSGDDFLQLLSGVEEPPAETQATQQVATTSLEGFLALQEMSDEEAGRKKAVQNSRNLLDTLEQLRHALLMGDVPAHILKNLTRAVDMQTATTIMDPKLAAVVEDIKLRAAVEVAKLEMATQGQLSA